MAEQDSKETLTTLDSFEEIEVETGQSQGQIYQIAVIGGGTMGRGIAQAVAGHGIPVILVEKDLKSMKTALKLLQEEMDQEIERWGMTKSDKRAILARVEPATDLKRVKECDLAIEAIIEDFDAKSALFEKLDKLCPEGTIFVTNTSSLSITELAARTSRDDKIIGLHFLNPVPKVPLVEIIRGLKTGNDTFQRVREFVKRIDKIAVEVFEYPGYITTRIIVTMINEAMFALMEGVASAEDIDLAMKLGFNFALGPLALADQMGLDTIMQWMETLFRELGDLKYRPCPMLRKLVRAGHLGKKTGRGFYNYDEHGRRVGIAIAKGGW